MENDKTAGGRVGEGARRSIARLIGHGHLVRRVMKACREGRFLEAVRWRLVKLAPSYRALLLRRVVFIGVTGSCGKTTTKELTGAILATRFRGQMSSATHNAPPHLDRAVLRVKPWDDFCLLELSPADKAGKRVFDRVLRLVRPQIGVVTIIGTDHIKVFHSIEAIAAEKGKLIAALPPHGTAVLNFDDPNIRDMQSLCAGRVISYGLAQDAMLRADQVRASWPEPLSFTLCYEGRSYPVRTQLYGAHFVSCVLAAVAVGLALDVPLAAALVAVGTVPPFGGRMQPVDHPAGFTFIRDDYKASLWSIPAALQFVKEARAPRKFVVIGTISDTTGTSSSAYVTVARQALEVADRVIFVGRLSSKCLKAKRHPRDEALKAFYSVETAAQHLRSCLQAGDLVLLKGSDVDRLDVIVTESMRPQDAVASEPMDLPSTDSPERLQVVVGLGNAGEEYDETPHNVGHRVLDLLASILGAVWRQEADAMVARVTHGDRSFYFLKPLTAMNVIGPALLRTGQRLGFGSANCILVHDDIDLSLGSVRVRERAGDAGHRGVRSVLESFRTDEVRRVRIGVGRPVQGKQSRHYVLATYSPAERSVIDEVCAKAADRVLELLGIPKGSNPVSTARSQQAPPDVGSLGAPEQTGVELHSPRLVVERDAG